MIVITSYSIHYTKLYENGYALVEDATGVLSQWNNSPNTNANENAPKERDEWEIRIPLSFFSADVETIKEITFFCPNIGKEKLIATGTPTLPFIAAAFGLILAATSIQLSKRKIKK